VQERRHIRLLEAVKALPRADKVNGRVFVSAERIKFGGGPGELVKPDPQISQAL
jgi:hypothetical protein